MKVIKKIKILILCLTSIVLYNSCVTKSNYQTLSFFFDGVNNPDSTAVADSMLVQTKADTISSTIVKSNSSIHPPFSDRSCDNCHSKSNNFVLIEKMPELCYSCHEDFSNNNSVIHGPIASGNCNECHNSHNSNFPKLLINYSQDLCLKCHDIEDIKNNFVHDDIGDEKCWSCHDPHGSNSKYLIK